MKQWVGAALVLLVLTGCGGGDNATAPVTSTVSVMATTTETVETTTTKTSVSRTTIHATVTLDPVAMSESAAASASSVAAASASAIEAAARLQGQEGYVAQMEAAGLVHNVRSAEDSCESLGTRGVPSAGIYSSSLADWLKTARTEALQEVEIMTATICPEHRPLLDEAKAKIAADAEAAAVRSQEAADLEAKKAAGEWAGGSNLVGSEPGQIRPGLWQSIGEKVEDCYWEISDAQGNIIDNNFISVAPQFTVRIPASAAGFTANYCQFERIGD